MDRDPSLHIDNHLIVALSIGVLLGMAVAMAVYLGWRSGAIVSGFDHPATDVALVVCPPFILSLIVPAHPDAALALVLTAGTIVFANGFLYAGVAAAAYFFFDLARRRKARRV
jgi:hypothetical protein